MVLCKFHSWNFMTIFLVTTCGVSLSTNAPSNSSIFLTYPSQLYIGSCNSTEDCPLLNYCANNTCQPQGRPRPSCKTTLDCNTPLKCVDNVCIRQGDMGEECLTNEDCNPFLVCKDQRCSLNVAHGGFCLQSYDCPHGEFCFRNVCRTKVGIGEECTSTEDCVGVTNNLICYWGQYSTGRCRCKVNYRYDPESNNCIKVHWTSRLPLFLGILCVCSSLLVAMIYTTFKSTTRRNEVQRARRRMLQAVARFHDVSGNRNISAETIQSLRLPVLDNPPSYAQVNAAHVKSVDTPPPTYGEVSFKPTKVSFSDTVNVEMTEGAVRAPINDAK